MIGEPCRNCDAAGRLNEVGLCALCQDRLRFVVRPEAHREHYRRTLVAEGSIRRLLEQIGFVTITSLPEDNSLWICDLCNSRIPVAAEHTLIPMLGDYALCMTCTTAFHFWPDGWTRPAPRACRCGACQRPILAALTVG